MLLTDGTVVGPPRRGGHGQSRPVVREAFIELVATAFLLIAVVGSGFIDPRLRVPASRRGAGAGRW